jgi:hypothetical protein
MDKTIEKLKINSKNKSSVSKKLNKNKKYV